MNIDLKQFKKLQIISELEKTYNLIKNKFDLEKYESKIKELSYTIYEFYEKELNNTMRELRNLEENMEMIHYNFDKETMKIMGDELKFYEDELKLLEKKSYTLLNKKDYYFDNLIDKKKIALKDLEKFNNSIFQSVKNILGQ